MHILDCRPSGLRQGLFVVPARPFLPAPDPRRYRAVDWRDIDAILAHFARLPLGRLRHRFHGLVSLAGVRRYLLGADWRSRFVLACEEAGRITGLVELVAPSCLDWRSVEMALTLEPGPRETERVRELLQLALFEASERDVAEIEVFFEPDDPLLRELRPLDVEIDTHAGRARLRLRADEAEPGAGDEGFPAALPAIA